MTEETSQGRRLAAITVLLMSMITLLGDGFLLVAMGQYPLLFANVVYVSYVLIAVYVYLWESDVE